KDTVPGFRLDFCSRRGSRKWNEGEQGRLIADIEAVKARKKCGDRGACHVLVTSPRYKKLYGENPKKLSSNKKAHALNTRLVEARNATIVARLLARADGTIKQLLTDRLIGAFD